MFLYLPGTAFILKYPLPIMIQDYSLGQEHGVVDGETRVDGGVCGRERSLAAETALLLPTVLKKFHGDDDDL